MKSETLWTPEDLAEYCQVKESVVKNWVYTSDIPYLKLGKFIRFKPSEVKEWIDKQRKEGGIDNSDLKLVKSD